jgi:hypothetical protein
MLHQASDPLWAEIDGLTNAQDAHKVIHHSQERTNKRLFTIGGALSRLLYEQWFAPYANFSTLVKQEFGYQPSRAYAMVQVYRTAREINITAGQIEMVGWTKMLELMPIITPENADEWLKRAADVSRKELRKLVKAATPPVETLPAPQQEPVVLDDEAVEFQATDIQEAVEAYLKKIGWVETLCIVEKLWPDLDMHVDKVPGDKS